MTKRKDLVLDEVSEKDASGEVATTYERIKEGLRSSFVPFMWRVFATKPAFLRAAWDQVEPAVDLGFMEAADALRATALERVREVTAIADHSHLLADDLQRAVEQLRVFLEVNPRQLLLLCALRRSWRGETVGGHRDAIQGPRGVPPWHPKIELGSDSKVSETLADMEETLDLPVPNTDYRMLAAWPDYLSHAWIDLRAFILTEPWTELCRSLDLVSEQLAIGLPAAIAVSSDHREDLGLEEDDVAEVGRWIEAFHGLLPGLIVNTSYLWLGLKGGTERIAVTELLESA